MNIEKVTELLIIGIQLDDNEPIDVTIDMVKYDIVFEKLSIVLSIEYLKEKILDLVNRKLIIPIANSGYVYSPEKFKNHIEKYDYEVCSKIEELRFEKNTILLHTTKLGEEYFDSNYHYFDEYTLYL